VESSFTTIVDVAHDGDSLYVLQITSEGFLGGPSPGKLIRVNPDGSRTELAEGELEQPTGMTIGEDGDVYVANNGTSGTDGQIVRIETED
jgi:sugar lactone lactonase YvrE